MTDPTPSKKLPCEWIADEEGNYDTGCGEKFIFIDDGPRENGFKFCCYCGRTLKAKAVFTSSMMRQQVKR